MASLEAGSPLYFKTVLTVTGKGLNVQNGKYSVTLVDATNNNNSGSFFSSTNLQLVDLTETDCNEFELGRNYEIKFYRT
jgi:hypothetical protein